MQIHKKHVSLYNDSNCKQAIHKADVFLEVVGDL